MITGSLVAGIILIQKVEHAIFWFLPDTSGRPQRILMVNSLDSVGRLKDVQLFGLVEAVHPLFSGKEDPFLDFYADLVGFLSLALSWANIEPWVERDRIKITH